MSAAQPTWWEREPALIVGQAKALIGLLAACGFGLSGNLTGTIVSAAAGLAAIAGSLVVRRQVTSPATVAQQQAASQARLAQASAAISSAGAPPAALPCPAVPIITEPVRDPATGWPTGETASAPTVVTAAPVAPAAATVTLPLDDADPTHG